LAAEGAQGDTFHAILGSLQLSDEFDLSSWTSIIDTILGDESVTVMVGNSVWTRKDAKVLETYRDALVSRYRAEQHAITDHNAVNDWVSKMTNGMIPSVLDQIEPTCFMLLINSIYFKAKWRYPFPQAFSSESRFKTALGPRAYRNRSTVHFQFVPPI
jgi:serine protease inhibitor